LTNLEGVNCHKVNPDIARVHVCVADSALGDAGHMAVYTFHEGAVIVNGCVTFFLEVTLFTGGAGGLNTIHAQLDDTSMGVVAGDTVDSDVLALEEFFILLVVLDKALGCVDLLNITAAVAGATFFAVPVDFHCNTAGVRCM
jgi:hypothetical protein